jgi:hypothetical protein
VRARVLVDLWVRVRVRACKAMPLKISSSARSMFGLPASPCGHRVEYG